MPTGRWIAIETLTDAQRAQLHSRGYRPAGVPYWKPFCTVHRVGPIRRFIKELPPLKDNAVFPGRAVSVSGKMTQEDFLNFHTKFTETCYKLSKDKNTDYAEPDNALANFEMFGEGAPALLGVVHRLGDKLRRLHAFATRGELKCESATDTCQDIVNYAVLAAAILRQASHE